MVITYVNPGKSTSIHVNQWISTQLKFVYTSKGLFVGQKDSLGLKEFCGDWKISGHSRFWALVRPLLPCSCLIIKNVYKAYSILITSNLLFYEKESANGLKSTQLHTQMDQNRLNQARKESIKSNIDWQCPRANGNLVFFFRQFYPGQIFPRVRFFEGTNFPHGNFFPCQILWTWGEGKNVWTRPNIGLEGSWNSERGSNVDVFFC